MIVEWQKCLLKTTRKVSAFFSNSKVSRLKHAFNSSLCVISQYKVADMNADEYKRNEAVDHMKLWLTLTQKRESIMVETHSMSDGVGDNILVRDMIYEGYYFCCLQTKLLSTKTQRAIALNLYNRNKKGTY